MEKNSCCKSALFAVLFYAWAGAAVSLNLGVSIGVGTSQAPGLNEGLKEGFYSLSCPQAEITVYEEVKNAFISNPEVAAGLVRMHFHDCFVRVGIYSSYSYKLYTYLLQYNIVFMGF